ncbi:MAG: response regulator [Candidatus Sumerlaeia bacterium]
MKKNKILVIDDDPEVLAFREVLLRSEGYEVFSLEGGDQLMYEMERIQPNLVITDIMMPGLTGGAVYEILRQNFEENIPVIVSSVSKIKIRGKGDPYLAYVSKEEDADIMLSTINRLLNSGE